MEKAQIVRYALMQLTALIYAVLGAATAVRINRPLAEQGYPMPDPYYRAVSIRDYGCWLFVFVILWTVFAVHQSQSPNGLSEETLTATGIGLALLFAIAGTFIAIAGAAAPAYSTLHS
jgi:hypothetical protein